MASIFILFPKENSEHVSSALQHVQWAIERFETMAECNRLAASARGVLRAIQIRLRKALGITHPSYIPISMPAASEINGTPSTASILDIQNTSTTAQSPSVEDSTRNDTSRTSLFTTPESGCDNLFGTGGPLSGQAALNPASMAANDWTLPDNFDWASIQPVYAMADVAYNDLMGINNGREESTIGASEPNWACGAAVLNNLPPGSITPNTEGDSQGWSFGGDFSNDSVWSLLNHFSQA